MFVICANSVRIALQLHLDFTAKFERMKKVKKKRCKYSVELFLLPTFGLFHQESHSHESRAFESMYVYTATVVWTRFNSVGVVTWVVLD